MVICKEAVPLNHSHRRTSLPTVAAVTSVDRAGHRHHLAPGDALPQLVAVPEGCCSTQGRQRAGDGGCISDKDSNLLVRAVNNSMSLPGHDL